MATTKPVTKLPAQQPTTKEVAAIQSAQTEKTVAEEAAKDAAVEKIVAERSEREAAEAAAAKEAEDPEDEADDDEDADEPEAQESKVAAKENLKLTPEDEQVLDRLAKLWQPVSILDLRTRHEMGTLVLNTYYKGTEGRGKYGDKVVLIAAIRLDLPSDELHRMKKFALKFPNFDVFLKAHPDANWSRVKRDHLPEKKSHKRNKWVSRVEQVTKLLDAMLEEQAELKKNVAPTMLEELSKKLLDVNQAVALVIIPGQVFDADGKPIGVQDPANA